MTSQNIIDVFIRADKIINSLANDIDNHRYIELAYKLGQLESLSIQLGDETIRLRNELRSYVEDVPK